MFGVMGGPQFNAGFMPGRDRPVPQAGGNAMNFIMQNGMERARREQMQKRVQEQVRLQVPMMQGQGRQQRPQAQAGINRGVQMPANMQGMPRLMGPQGPNMAGGNFNHMAQAGNLGGMGHMAFAQGAQGPMPGMGMPQGMAQMGPQLAAFIPRAHQFMPSQVQQMNHGAIPDFRAMMPTMQSQGWRDVASRMGGGLAAIKERSAVQPQPSFQANYGFGNGYNMGMGRGPVNANYMFRGY